jgi:hypothetical protein
MMEFWKGKKVELKKKSDKRFFLSFFCMYVGGGVHQKVVLILAWKVTFIALCGTTEISSYPPWYTYVFRNTLPMPVMHPRHRTTLFYIQCKKSFKILFVFYFQGPRK